jgi:hypothetical protein
MPGPNPHDRAHQLIANCATKIFAANNCTTTNQWAAETLGKILHRRGSFNENQGGSANSGMNMGGGENWGSSYGGNSGYSSSGKGGNSSSYSGNWGRSKGGNASHGLNRGLGENWGTSQGYSEQLDYLLAPDFFSRGLKTGGPANANRVSCVWTQAGRVFNASGGTALLTEFVQ